MPLCIVTKILIADSILLSEIEDEDLQLKWDLYTAFRKTNAAPVDELLRAQSPINLVQS